MGREEKPTKSMWFLANFPPFFEIKIIKLATSRPLHFLGRHLQQHFCKNAIVYLRTVAI
jgi:hypothetical protein